jgi:hypothetical protein
MDNNLSFNIGISKNDIPYAIRSYLKFIFNRGKKNITNNDTPEEILNELKQAAYNKIYEREHQELANQIVNNMNMDIDWYNKSLVHKLKKMFGEKDIERMTTDRYLNGGVSYDNYNPVMINGNAMMGIAPNATFTQNIKAIGDPSYNAQMSVGSFDINRNKNGNIIATDRYNINAGNDLHDVILNALHTLAKHKTDGAYNRMYDLGNPKDWGMEYTGNGYLRDGDYDRHLFGRGFYQRGYDQNIK